MEELSATTLQLVQAADQTSALQAELNVATQSLAALPQLRYAVAADQRMFIELRQELIRALCDVDLRRNAIVEQQTSVLDAIDAIAR